METIFYNPEKFVEDFKSMYIDLGEETNQWQDEKSICAMPTKASLNKTFAALAEMMNFIIGTERNPHNEVLARELNRVMLELDK